MGMFYCADHLRKSGDDPDYPLQSFWRKASPYIMMFVFFALLNVYQLDASVQSGHSYEWVSLQMYSLLAIPFFPLAHRGKKPSPGLKYAFYVFYGLHLFLLMAFSAQLRMR